jgi:hypothetical protein
MGMAYDITKTEIDLKDIPPVLVDVLAQSLAPIMRFS